MNFGNLIDIKERVTRGTSQGGGSYRPPKINFGLTSLIGNGLGTVLCLFFIYLYHYDTQHPMKCVAGQISDILTTTCYSHTFWQLPVTPSHPLWHKRYPAKFRFVKDKLLVMAIVMFVAARMWHFLEGKFMDRLLKDGATNLNLKKIERNELANRILNYLLHTTRADGYLLRYLLSCFLGMLFIISSGLYLLTFMDFSLDDNNLLNPTYAWDQFNLDYFEKNQHLLNAYPYETSCRKEWMGVSGTMLRIDALCTWSLNTILVDFCLVAVYTHIAALLLCVVNLMWLLIELFKLPRVRIEKKKCMPWLKMVPLNMRFVLLIVEKNVGEDMYQTILERIGKNRSKLRRV